MGSGIPYLANQLSYFIDFLDLGDAKIDPKDSNPHYKNATQKGIPNF